MNDSGCFFAPAHCVIYKMGAIWVQNIFEQFHKIND